MPNSITMLLDPVPAPSATGIAGPPMTVRGCRPRFSLFGKGLTRATKDADQPAKIEFVARLLKSVLGNPEPSERILGTIDGQLRLVGSPPRVVFHCDPASLAKLESPAISSITDSSTVPRAIDLILSSPEFENVANASDCPPQLLLPKDLASYRYIELMAQLTLGGSVEAARDVNDVLDLPIWSESPPRARAYGIQLIDEVGEPLAGAKLEFHFAGQSVSRVTDADGRAIAISQSPEASTVNIVDAAALRNELKKRWSVVRNRSVLDVDAPLANRFPNELETGISTVTRRPAVICLRPRVTLGRIVGWVFDRNKSFPLPHVMSGLRAIVELCEQNPKSTMLLVGHTDTTGEPSTNDPLSLERAESLKAFFTGDGAAWQKYYDSSVSEARRWGEHEDLLMMQTVAGADIVFAGNPVLAYQKHHNALLGDERSKHHESVKEDGKVGPSTRKQLIADYMNVSGTTVADGTTFVSHGCGENFPLDASGDSVDSMPVDGSDDPMDRRVELYLFDEAFGIQPAPPGKNSMAGGQEYLEWRKRAKKAVEVVSQRGQIDVKIRLGQAYRYRLTAGDFILVGENAADASITREIPIVSEQAELHVEGVQSGEAYTWPITLRQLDDVAAVSGMQQRLANLGYYVGPVDGQNNEQTQWSLTAFQHDQGLAETGIYNPDTQTALKRAHDA